MKKIFTTLLLAGLTFAGATGAKAQNLPDKLNGYYRLTNAAFNEALTVEGRYDFTGTVPSPTNAGSIFEIQTGEMASLASEMEKLEQMLNAGLITQDEYMRLFMQLLSSSNTWFYGCFPLEKFSSQGVDYAAMIKKLPDYADLGIETFINNDAGTLYNEHRSELTLLCVFASEIINPSNIETEAAFKKWCENYLTAWRNNTIFQVYMQPVYQTPEDPEDESPSYFTGNYYFRFHTPPYVGNMQKAQKYINSILTDNGNITDVDTLDIWSSAKHYIMQEIAVDYPEGTPAYEFVYKLFEDTMMDVDYIIGESEEGGLKFQALPGTFSGFEGYEGPDITITADDVARCTWMLEPVNAASPFAIQPNPMITDAEGNYYSTLYTAFPYQLSAGMKAYYASSVGTDGVPTLVEFAGNKIAAETPVIIRSTSANILDNKILPLTEGGETADGNALKGVLFAQTNNGSMVTLQAGNNGPFFDSYLPEFPANTAYYDGELAGVSSIYMQNNGETKVYDMMGREVKDPNAKGIFIINGKKVIRF